MRSDRDDVRQLVAQAGRTYAPARWLTPAAVVCLAVGVVAFVVGVLVAPGRAWASLLANFLFWTGVAQASVVVAAAFTTAGSAWGRVILRIATMLSAFLPLSLVLLLLVWLGGGHLFDWQATAHGGLWFALWVILLRDFLALAAMAALSLWFVALSLRPDLGAGARGGLAGRLTRGWRGDREEREHSDRRMRTLAPAILIGYAFAYSLLAFDLSMSVVRDFHSTMYPVIYWMGSFYGALAVTTILVAAWHRAYHLGEVITPGYTRDLGNMTWSFAIFWAYLSWGQYFAMWYTNLPHEAGYVVERYRVMPWQALSWVALVLTFVVPFVLLFSRRLKSHPQGLAIVGAIGVLGLLMQRHLEILPFVPALGPSTFGLVEVGISLGFVGLVALPYLWVARRVPLFPVSDPLFARAMAVRHVEA